MAGVGPFLEALAAEDLSFTLESGLDFDAPQEMTEEFRQVVNFRTALGHRGPVIKNKRPDDSATFSFSVILLQNPSSKALNGEKVLKSMSNFIVQVRWGTQLRTYQGCEWTRISRRGTQDETRLDCDIMIPGYYNANTE